MKKSHIVIGLGYGDEGKGSWVDYLVREHDIEYVVRFNGGPQARHNVVSSEGITHGFSQFGSGTLVPGTKTCLSKYVLVDPFFLEYESQILAEKGIDDSLNRMLLDDNCPVITPFNLIFNQLEELNRGDKRHGSCGCGVGVTQGDVEFFGDKYLYMNDLMGDSGNLCAKLIYLWRDKLRKAKEFELVSEESLALFNGLKQVAIGELASYYQEFAKKVQIVSSEKILEIISQNSVVFEGAQGVLLDRSAGFSPYITRSNTTFDNALLLLHESGFEGEVVKIGLLRGYATRHGAGPFITEDSELQLIEEHNHVNPWQGKFRFGWFDCVAVKYALDIVGGVDILGITNLDKMKCIGNLRICSSYSNGLDCYKLKENPFIIGDCYPIYKPVSGWQDCNSIEDIEHYLKAIESIIGCNIGAVSISPTSEGKIILTCVGESF